MFVNRIFHLRGNPLGRLMVEARQEGTGLRRCVVRIDYRRGAGYIGGFSIFFALNSSSASWLRYYRNIRRGWRGLEFGVTRNANIIPYLSH